MKLSLRYHNSKEKYVIVKDNEKEIVFKLDLTKKNMKYMAERHNIEFIDFSRMEENEKEKLVNNGGF